MLRFFNAILVLAVLGSAFVLYNLEHATRGTERQIARSERAIAAERESIKLLNAEWSSLTRPERLQRLAEKHLEIKPIAAMQMVTEAELAERVPAYPPVRIDPTSADPIGDILKKME